jgi:hypothetical protein
MRRSGGGRRGARVAALLIATLMSGAAPAAATTVARIETTAQAVTADRIFVGTVTSVTSRPKAAKPKYFETVVRFDVEDTVAGSVPSTIELTFSGGDVGGIRQKIGGMPEFVVGERYVVLVEPDRQPALASPVVGFNQGLYRVIGTSRASAVVRDRVGKPLAPTAGAARAAGTDPPLDEFLDGLRAARGQ